MLEDWVEPPKKVVLDLSTLTHQMISTIAEIGAVSAMDLYTLLCKQGAFRAVTPKLFSRLLRALGEKDIVEQSFDGLLILGLIGEKLRSRQDFYAAFATPSEFTVSTERRALGTLPVAALPKKGDHIVFAARRWLVTNIDSDRRMLYVKPAKRRKKPVFLSAGGIVHHRVVDRMMAVLGSDEEITYLDSCARETLSEARATSKANDLARRGWYEISSDACMWLTWTGSEEMTAYQALLSSEGIESSSHGFALRCSCPADRLKEIINRYKTLEPDMHKLARHVPLKQLLKYDEYLPDSLLEEVIATNLRWLNPNTG